MRVQEQKTERMEEIDSTGGAGCAANLGPGEINLAGCVQGTYDCGDDPGE